MEISWIVCGLTPVAALGLPVWVLRRIWPSVKGRMNRRVLLGTGLALLGIFAALYLGHCTGTLGNIGLLCYLFQCSCPRSLENLRYQKLYSE